MDLRWRLVVRLGALLLALVLATLGVVAYSLRSDTEAEVRASERLVQVLALASRSAQSDEPAVAAAMRLQQMLKDAPLRHLSVRLGDAPATEGGGKGWLAHWLLPGQPAVEQRIRIGQLEFTIAPNRESELQEKLADALELFIILLAFSGVAVAMTWYAAHRALAPVRELEAGLDRLAHGAARAELPAFELQEFQRVAAAIDQLSAALAESRAAEGALAQRLIRLQDEERKALARELHDEMGQTLTALATTATYLERKAAELPVEQIVACGGELNRDIRISRDQLRAMLRQLNPHDLDGIGLPRALRALVAGWQQRVGALDFTLEVPSVLPAMADAVALAAFRIVQEGVTNVLRHAGASRCRIVVDARAGSLEIEVLDDGRGMAGHGPGVGMAGMKARAGLVGGVLDVFEATPHGLCLRARLPLAGSEQMTTDDGAAMTGEAT